MPFRTIPGWLTRPGAENVDPGPMRRIGALPAAFSDDLLVGGAPVAVRVILTDDGAGGYRLDASESDACPDGNAPMDRVQDAVVLALALALGRSPTAGLSRKITLTPGGACGGPGEAADPARSAFILSRTVDAVLGALQRVWPDAVGAGSCTLGALVRIESEAGVLLEALPGGEGARPDRPGQPAWPSPILRAPAPALPPDIQVSRSVRAGSGGGGARRGGDGVVSRYAVASAARVDLRMDRTTNPPHGVDRAGPPRGSFATVEHGGSAVRVDPWSTLALLPDSTLVVETCGGAGHGFPGYGDIEFDGSAWFGDAGKRR